MNSEAIKCMMNPLRLRILHEIRMKGKVTTKEILEVCEQDIPQATLYRHLNILLKNGIIEVVSENKIKGIIEKVYSIKSNPFDEINADPTKLSKEELSEFFSQFVFSLYIDFENYIARDNMNILQDIIGFSNESIYLTKEEYLDLRKEIDISIKKRMSNKPSNDRELIKVSTVYTPYNQREDSNK